MKRLYTLVFTLLIGLSAWCNPIATPNIYISELLFDDADNWKLEIGYIHVVPAIGEDYNVKIDTVFLYSSSDTAIIKRSLYLPNDSTIEWDREDELYGTLRSFVLTTDSLDRNFHINRMGDSLTVGYNLLFDDGYNYFVKKRLLFGNVPGATVYYPKKGQSICSYDDFYGGLFYYKDNSPTMGLPNDTNDANGTLSGIIYDKRSTPVANGAFTIYEWHNTYDDVGYKEKYSFISDRNGNYSVPVLSYRARLNYLFYKVGSKTQDIIIDGISYFVEPDSVTRLDIHIPYDLSTDIQRTLPGNGPVTLSPNPVSTGEKIKVNVDLPSLTTNLWLELIDPSGRLVHKARLQQTENTIDAPSSGGMYLARILLDGRVIATEKILVRE